MSQIPEHVVVVGAGLGGLRTVEQLRSRGHTGRITLIGAEVHPPYDRPPLSKQILNGTWEPAKATFRDLEGLAELDVTTVFGKRAVGLDGTTVQLEDGTAVSGDVVVLATGVTARTLPGQPAGVVTLRTLDDAIALRGAFDSLSSLLIVGAGFIGAEVACAAHARGVQVTVLEALPVPVERALGREVGALAARLFTEGGIDLRCDTRITRFVDERTVELSDGSTLGADLVLVGIGSLPDVDWLASSGFDTTNGVACDASGRVVGTSGVWALGDIASWWDESRGRHHRNEHWTTTVDQSSIVASDILGTEPPAATVPYVWSDQFGMKVQTFGRTDLADEVAQLHGTGMDGGPVKGTVVGYFAGGVLVGVVGFGAPAKLVRYRAMIAEGAARDAVLAQSDAGSAVGG
ncbi:NAD(P)/FAD-dependent oxidoreductase [Trujillonella endophytica]|uniref:NADPH-dependent 2,4-dienoyl-CoA reductase, sulfur reductase n=1 Tax=Trujillonella endophytica TaxID=673521 RepID=A0A1H8W7P8_9ACTN|nr:FAD-dependent oxidoreductase [Trujillella endophytica]SEP23640.1 NADPH-dependent 2,4-dienoyl-CoA reductase, sulfur reductase [Trujillella endophytica]